jgi:hypothetical protein
MSDPKNSTAVYLIPGMSAKIKALESYVSPKAKAKFPDDNGSYVELPLVQGFAVLHGDVGTIEIVPGEPAVKYIHKKFSMNKIYFLSRTGEKGVVDVISIQIHDHSSIVTGGPAYGTYFTDDETLGGV